jgi:aspartate/methionine/tyrosine aminotransferase
VQALSKKLAEEEGILIHPARILGSDDHHMRIGLGREGFAEALQKFEQWLEKDL